jgi:cytochrome c553
MNKLTLSAMLTAGALLAAPTPAADVTAGKALTEGACMDCLGDDGKGDDENPNIVRMDVAKFTKAMKEYHVGTRTKDATMAKAAKELSDADLANLAAHYATLK